MIEHINWLAVIVASLATFLAGGLWYSPLLFLKPWQSDMGLVDSQPGHPARVFGLSYVFSLVSCTFVAAVLGPGPTVIAGLKTGLLLGICAVFCSFGINYQFANRPTRVLFIDGGYHVLQFSLFGLVIGAWPG